MSDILVRPANMPEFRTTREQLRVDVESGRAPPQTAVSLDGGATWQPAWSAAGLGPPKTSTEDATKYLVPIGRSGWAIVTGYLSLFTMLIVPVAALMLVAVVDTPAKASEMLPVVGVFCLMGIPTQLATGLMAHRAIRRDPKLLGMGRVIYTYVCTGLLAALAAAILVVQLVVA